MLTNEVNQTIAIDLSKSFSTNASSGSSDVDLTFIDKGNAPNFNQISFWTDPSKRTTYAVGGALSNAPGHTEGGPPPDNQLWKFTQKSGSLGGIWSSVDTSGDPAWDSFIRPEGGLFDSGPVGGFYLGGYINAGTSSLVPQAVGIGNVAVPGMQFFNFTSGKLSNDSSSPGFSATGGGVSGGLVYVPTWGEAGLAVAFGGQDAPDLGAYVDGGAYRSFSNISIWDPATQKWYSQTATGEIPTERDKFCTVGVQGGDKSTFGKQSLGC